MRKLSKKIYISVFTLILTAVAAVTITFAWFTIGDTATVGDIEASVQGGEGLDMQIVNTDGEWYNNISTSKIDELVFGTDSNQLKQKKLLKAVTFDKAAKTLHSLIYKGSNAGNVDPTVADEGFITFDLKFRTPKTGSTARVLFWQDAQLGGEKIEFTVDKAHTGTNDNSLAKGDKVYSYAKYGARVMVGDIIYELAAETNTDDSKTSYNSAGNFKVAGAHDYYLQKGNKLLGIEYASADAYIALLEPLLSAQDYDTVHTLKDAEDDNVLEVTMAQETIDGLDYWVATLTVTIWIEGFDADSYNAIYDAPLSVSLAFGLKEQD